MDKLTPQTFISSQPIQNAAQHTLTKIVPKKETQDIITPSEQGAWEVFTRAVEKNGSDAEKFVMQTVNDALVSAKKAGNYDYVEKRVQKVADPFLAVVTQTGNYGLIEKRAQKAIYIACLQNFATGATGSLSQIIAKVAVDAERNNGFGLPSGTVRLSQINNSFAEGIEKVGNTEEQGAMQIVKQAKGHINNIDLNEYHVSDIQNSILKDVAKGINKPLKDYLIEKADMNTSANDTIGIPVMEKLRTMASDDEKVILDAAQKSLKGNRFNPIINASMHVIEHSVFSNLKSDEGSTLICRLAKIGKSVLDGASADYTEENWGRSGIYKVDRDPQVLQGLAAGTAFMNSIAANATNQREKVIATTISDILNITMNEDHSETMAHAHASSQMMDFGFKVINAGVNTPVEHNLAAIGRTFSLISNKVSKKAAIDVAKHILLAIANNAEDPKNAELAKNALAIKNSAARAIKSTLFMGKSNKEMKLEEYNKVFKQILSDIDIKQIESPSPQIAQEVKERNAMMDSVAEIYQYS